MTLTIITHAPGCQFVHSSRAVCSCNWERVVDRMAERIRELEAQLAEREGLERELEALRALEKHVRSPCGISSEPWPSEGSVSRSIWAEDILPLLKAIDEAREGKPGARNGG